VSLRRTSHQLLLLGTLLVVLSAFLPWFETHGLTSTSHVRPALTDTFGTAVWVVLGMLALGLVLFGVTGSPAIVGCVGALWLNSSLLVWLVGAKASLLVPGKLFSSQELARLGDGGSVGIAGGLIVVLSVAVILSEDTRRSELPYGPTWVTAVSLVLLIGCIAARQFNWFEIHAGKFEADVDVDLVPVLGDALSVMMLAVIVLLVIHLLFPKWWVSLPLLLASLLVILLSVIGLIGSWAVEKATTAAIRKVDFISSSGGELSRTAGPIYTLVLAALVAAFCGVLIVRIPRTRGDGTGVIRAPRPTVAAPPVMNPFDDDLPY
jgi:hypothetical protein